MTEARVEVVRIGEVTKHPNADTLSVTMVMGGYPCLFKTGDFNPGDLAVYVPIDSLVPVDRPEFAFLAHGKSHERIKARKLRGIFSMGLLVPAPVGAVDGQDVAEALGVEKWLPPSEREVSEPKHKTSRIARRSETYAFERRVWLGVCVVSIASLAITGWIGFTLIAISVFAARALIDANRKACKKPNVPVYDIEGLRKYRDILQEGEEVVITEKIHGCNASFVHTGKKFHVRSRTMFREDVGCNPGPNREMGPDLWWKAAKRYGLAEKMAKWPNLVLFGEIYGPDCQDLHYGCEPGQVGFRAFDLMDLNTRQYWDHDKFKAWCEYNFIHTVPELYRGPWRDDLANLAEGKSKLADHVREGIVIRPVHERHDMRLGRVILKIAGEGYLLRKAV